MIALGLRTAILLLLGALGGFVFSKLPMPLPFLLGSMAASAAVVGFAPERLLKGFDFPEVIRQPFLAVIGLMIGTQVHLERLTDPLLIGGLLVAITLFAPLAHGVNYKMMRRLGGYDRPTAFFSAAPGGLLEALLLGEKSGAHVGILTVQQFLRIILVVTLIPLAMSIWVGHPVGSAAGLSALINGAASPLWQIALVGAAGYGLGRHLRLPAGQLTGALLLSGLLTATGWLPLTMPGWLFIAAQVVVGTALGLRFAGLDGRTLRRGAALSFTSTLVMLLLGLALTLILKLFVPLRFDAALLAFAPGGVTEMSLVALSLAADPALVTLAHVYRIALTVFVMGWGYKRLSRSPSPQA